MHPPHRNAAASSHGDSRSPLSRTESIQIGTADNSVEIDGARRNTAAASPLIPGEHAQVDQRGDDENRRQGGVDHAAPPDFRNGGAVSKRSPEEVGIDN